MRKTLLVWCLGLAGIGSITGCGIFRQAREARCAESGQCSQPISVRNGASRTYVSSEAIQAAPVGNLRRKSSSEVVVIVENSTSRIPNATGAPPHLPELGRASRRIDLPTVDILSEAGEIAQHEVAAELPMAETIVELPEAASPTVKEPMPAPEKALVIKSVDIQNGPAEKFTKLTGQVQQFRKGWRLRYADIAQEDPYGGVVLLDGGPEMSQLRDGQQVRVTGVLVPPETRTSSAIYRVKAIEILD